ncbi:hypothetical protein O0L34_g1845 [Tuta absoluta]|nr:hypothetical protein O0L34_g1845 [Tuta absoluta]
MSLGARATKGGAKTGKEKPQDKGKQDKPQPKDKAKPQTRSAQDKDKPQPKEKVKPQATTEQLRMANMIDRKSDDATEVRKMVNELMEMTRRSEEEVCSALHDSDNDLVAACNLLLEDTQRIQGEWQTNEKKKKNKQPAGGNGEAEPPREREPRSRSGPRPRRGEGEGGRGRGSGRGRGGARGATRGGRGGRGRAPPRRSLRTSEPGWENNDNVGGNSDFPPTEDWDIEEWSGSTKVFTPSSAPPPVPAGTPPQAKQEDWDSPEANGPLDSIPTYTYHSTLAAPPASAPAPAVAPAQHPAQGNDALHRGEQLTTANNLAYSEAPPLDSYRTTPHHQPMGMSGTLTAAQSQYLSQLTAGSGYQQHSQPHVQPQHVQTHQEQRGKQRARLPPPSKIPSSAVEMPGGGGEGAMFLDVQFGALEPDALDPPPAPQQSHTALANPSQPSQHQANMVSQHHNATKQLQPEPAAVSQAAHEPEPSHTSHSAHSTHQTHQSPATTYQNANSMLSESLSVADSAPSSQQPASQTDSIVTNTTTSLEKQLSQGMKQLSVSSNDANSMQYAQQPTHQAQQSQHRTKVHTYYICMPTNHVG